VPLSDIDYGIAEEEAVLRVLRSRWLSMGAEVSAFEREFAEYVGVRHALSVANGTAALQLALLAVGVGPGDEVVQPAINFVASSNMTKAISATPVFADIPGLDEPTISPLEVERKLTRRTRAVIVMHYGGYLCQMHEIRDLCASRGIALIEDACHAVGATYDLTTDAGKVLTKAGNLGDVGCFSFFSNKNLATGEGGVVTTNSEEVAKSVRLLRSHGMSSMTWDRHRGHANSYDVTTNGFNYRFDEIRASLGRCQLEKLDRNNRRRKELVHLYWKKLSALMDWTFPFAKNEGNSAYHLMVAIAPSQAIRDHAAKALREHGVQTSMHYPCITEFAAFAEVNADVSTSREFAQRAITLPLFPTMSQQQVELVCAALLEASSQKDGKSP
jgi:dTDP-4-amino-4,6-dideoxygalactose transaminase